MGKANTKSHRRRYHTSTKKNRDPHRISSRNMREVEKLFAETGQSTVSQEAKPMSVSKLAKMLRKSQKTFKVKSFGKRALSLVSEATEPVIQVKTLGELIKKHADYLLRKHSAIANMNMKGLVQNEQAGYDIAIVQIQDNLLNKIKTFGSEYVKIHGFDGIPPYEKGEDPYEDIEKMTEFLAEFERTIQTHAPEMRGAYMGMMRQIVDEMMKVINASLEKVGEKKANNVNALTALFAGL